MKAVEKSCRLRLNCFPINLVFIIQWLKKRVNWGTKEARLPPCNQNRKRHCSPRSPSPGNSEPTVETQCWKRPRTREENEVKRERTVGVHSMESSPVLCQGCLALRWEFAGDQAASSIHVANDRNTTGKCWEGRGWLEPLPADTGQVTNSSQSWQIAAAYTDSFYTFFYVGRIFTVRQQTLSWEKSDLDSTKLHRFNTTGHKTPAQRRRKRNNHTRIQEIQHR